MMVAELTCESVQRSLDFVIGLRSHLGIKSCICCCQLKYEL